MGAKVLHIIEFLRMTKSLLPISQYFVVIYLHISRASAIFKGPEGPLSAS